MYSFADVAVYMIQKYIFFFFNALWNLMPQELDLCPANGISTAVHIPRKSFLPKN